MTQSKKYAYGPRQVANWVTRGFFHVTQNGFALLGLAVVFATITLLARPDLRDAGESQLRSWLQDRQAAISGLVAQVGNVPRATASNPQDLPKPQAAVAFWLSKKYNIAPEPLSALVAEAFETGKRAQLDPYLILAIMAIESGFNPFAQSSVGAQGLMQVMTKVHGEKYQNFGGNLAAFDPLANLRVGTQILQECIARAGSVEGGLKLYVGAANLEDDGGYANRVLAEHSRLVQVAQGKTVPMYAPVPAPTPSPEKAEPALHTVASIANE